MSHDLLDLKKLKRPHRDFLSKKMQVFEEIFAHCCKHIELQNDGAYATDTTFDLPIFVMGMPLYELEECAQFVISRLEAKGLRASFLEPNVVGIDWSHLVEQPILPKAKYKPLYPSQPKPKPSVNYDDLLPPKPQQQTQNTAQDADVVTPKQLEAYGLCARDRRSSKDKHHDKKHSSKTSHQKPNHKRVKHRSTKPKSKKQRKQADISKLIRTTAKRHKSLLELGNAS